MNIYIDIDDTICVYPDECDGDYSKAIPSSKKIKMVNDLYDAGNRITMWTARGTVSGIDWRAITESQLSEWGVKYHNLILGKPAYDLFIDDKAMNSLEVIHFCHKIANVNK